MGGSSKQTIGYQYFSFFLLFIGNPIEKMLGINFDKRGWHTPLIDEMGNPLSVGVIEKATLYGENEGGVAGQIHARYGTDDQEVVSFYKEYMESKGLQTSAYPFQSYLAFPDFYLGNSGYMKEMLLWPKRIHVRNDGRAQWYDPKSEIPERKAYNVNGIPEVEYYAFKYSINGSLENHNSNGEDGFRAYAKSSAYGGVPNPDIEESIYFIFTGSGIKQYKFMSLTILGNASVERLSLDKFGNFISFKHEIKNETNGEKKFRIDAIVVVEDGVVPYVKVTGAGAVWNGHTNYFNFDQASSYLPISGYFDTFGETGDINPIHKIREILTDDTAMNKPESFVNNDNFIKAADRIWDEGLGISWSITEKSCIDAINELCYHIESGIRVNRQTGLYEMVLFRDDWFEEDEIHTIAESKIKSMQYEITNADEVINQVNVNFYDRANIKNSSFSISENGLIQTLGRVNAETLDFPYFMNIRNAEIVANWKLKQLSTGAFKGSFTTGWREARKWNRYDLIRLPWSKRWTGTILVRIMSINLGGPANNEVSIDFIEVVPSTGMMNTSIVADDPIEKPLPPQACQYEPFEMPYYLAVMALGQRQVDDELAYESNFGLVGVVAEQPQSNSLYAIMKTHNGVEGEEWQRAASIQYSETADLDQIISRTSTSFTVKNWKKIANVPIGTLIQCGREWLIGSGEWMVFQGVDPYTGVVTVKRGALDTGPQEWDINSKLYFCGNDVAYDATEYVASEKVLVSALTTTPSGVLEQKGSLPVEMKARAIRPYPPANVKINDEYYPSEIDGNIVITWVHRNRLQQTGGEILGFYDGPVTIESGVTYQLDVFEVSASGVKTTIESVNVGAVNTYTINISSALSSSIKYVIELKSVRDGYESLQAFKHELATPLTAPKNLTAIYEV